MERKNGGTRWSEISAHDFFFLFFHRRANESVSFQRATKESEIFRLASMQIILEEDYAKSRPAL